MKTLIFNGSPRVKGDTQSLIQMITDKLDSEYKIVNAYRCDISPCIDCRYCWKNSGCAIKDEMQSVYDYIEECDNILIASPIYFSELTGKLLDVGSRLQTYFCSKFFRKEEFTFKSKKGAVILVGGGKGNAERPFETACTLLHHMNCSEIHDVVCCGNTDKVPAIENEQILREIEDLIEFFRRKSYVRK